MQAEAELEAIVFGAFPGAQLHSCEALSGGVSARAVVVELRTASGQHERIVVRRPTRDSDEEVLRCLNSERGVLARLEGFGVVAPRLRFVDLERRALVLDHVEGAPDLAPPHRTEQLAPMAEMLARIHRAPVDAALASSLHPKRDWWSVWPPEGRELDAALDERGVREALERCGPPQHPNATALLHGDYWPGNLLWRVDELVAVLDWESAKLGEPLYDLAITRLDVLWVFGAQAMQELTELYLARSAVDARDLPRWDLRVALRPMGNLARWAKAYPDAPLSRPDIDEPHLRAGHHWFVRQAIERLSSAPPSRT